MASSEPLSKKQLTNMAAEFDYKLTQAQLALADGDKETASKLQRELILLQSDIEQRTQWMLDLVDVVGDPGSMEDLNRMHSSLVQDPLDKAGLDTADQLVNEIDEREDEIDELEDEVGESKDEADEREEQALEDLDAADRLGNKTDEREEQALGGLYHGYFARPDSSELFVTKAPAPWWLGEVGYEVLTTRWLELGDEERDELVRMRRAFELHNLGSTGEIYVKETAQLTCSCGESCWLRQVGDDMDSLYPKDGLTKEEREAEKEAEEENRFHQRFTSKILWVLKQLGYRVFNCEEDIDPRVEKWLREILVLAKGKHRDHEPYEPGSMTEGGEYDPDLKHAKSLNLYCRWIGGDEHLEVDAQILELTRRLVESAE
jgi:hypothetical protein